MFNTLAKSEEITPALASKVRSYVVAENVKALFIQYSMLDRDIPRDEKEEKKQVSSEAPKEIKSLTWGNRKENQAIVPQRIYVWIDMWNEQKTESVRFSTLIPVLSYPTIDPKAEKKSEDKKVEEKKEAGPKVPDQTGNAPDKPALPTPSVTMANTDANPLAGLAKLLEAGVPT